MAKNRDNKDNSNNKSKETNLEIKRINESLRAQQQKAEDIKKGMTSGHRPKTKKDL